MQFANPCDLFPLLPEIKFVSDMVIYPLSLIIPTHTSKGYVELFPPSPKNVGLCWWPYRPFATSVGDAGINSMPLCHGIVSSPSLNWARGDVFLHYILLRFSGVTVCCSFGLEIPVLNWSVAWGPQRSLEPSLWQAVEAYAVCTAFQAKCHQFDGPLGVCKVHSRLISGGSDLSSVCSLSTEIWNAPRDGLEGTISAIILCASMWDRKH